MVELVPYHTQKYQLLCVNLISTLKTTKRPPFAFLPQLRETLNRGSFTSLSALHRFLPYLFNVPFLEWVEIHKYDWRALLWECRFFAVCIYFINEPLNQRAKLPNKTRRYWMPSITKIQDRPVLIIPERPKKISQGWNGLHKLNRSSQQRTTTLEWSLIQNLHQLSLSTNSFLHQLSNILKRLSETSLWLGKFEWKEIRITWVLQIS